jgi:hypothetical protein
MSKNGPMRGLAQTVRPEDTHPPAVGNTAQHGGFDSELIH